MFSLVNSFLSMGAFFSREKVAQFAELQESSACTKKPSKCYVDGPSLYLISATWIINRTLAQNSFARLECKGMRVLDDSRIDQNFKQAI